MSKVNLKDLISSVKVVAFDLDGTIYFGNTLACDALLAIERLRQREIKVCFFTNNSSRNRKEIAEKLFHLRIVVEEKDVYTSGFATAKYCSGKYEKAFVIGTESLCRELSNHEIQIVSDPLAAQALIIGLDTGFTYNKLALGLDALCNGSDFIVCNRDNNYPLEGGRIMPGNGSIVAALSSASEREPDVVIGKPSTYMLDLLMADNQLNASDILIIGDSYSSDIRMALKAGSPSLLLLNNKPTNHNCTTINSLSELL